MAMNEDRLYVLSANPHYAVPEDSTYMSDVYPVFFYYLEVILYTKGLFVEILFLSQTVSIF